MIINPHHTEGPYPGCYDNTVPGHNDWLLWWLDHFEVPFSQLELWGRAMHGRETGHLDELLARYRRWQESLEQ